MSFSSRFIVLVFMVGVVEMGILAPSFAKAAQVTVVPRVGAGAKLKSSTEPILRIPIERFRVDMIWPAGGSNHHRRYLVSALSPAGGGGIEWAPLEIPYHGERTGDEVQMDFSFQLPSPPPVQVTSITIGGYASGLPGEPIVRAELQNVRFESAVVVTLEADFVYADGLDADMDGHLSEVLGGDDCADDNAEAYPGAAETCDGVDTACDGVDDEVQICLSNATMGGSPMQRVPGGDALVGFGTIVATPERPVRVDPFAMDRYEVSQADFAACATCGAPAAVPVAGIAGYQDDLTRWGDHPVVGVTYAQAASYCASLGKRLPTEIEWEVAARGLAPSRRPWPFAEQETSLATFAGDPANAPHNTIGRQVDRPMPVDALPEGRSPFGVHHMTGNVAEWTASWYVVDRIAELPEILPDAPPAEPITGTAKVVKGGGWDSRAVDSHVYDRVAAPTGSTNANLGFRCAVDLP